MATLMTQSGARTFFQDYLNALGVPNNFDFSSSGAVFVDELLKQVGDLSNATWNAVAAESRNYTTHT